MMLYRGAGDPPFILPVLPLEHQGGGGLSARRKDAHWARLCAERLPGAWTSRHLELFLKFYF
jgi:hypothetical protein